MTIYNLYRNHVHRSYAMYEQGSALTLEHREPYSDCYYETWCEPTNLIFDLDDEVTITRNYAGEPILVPPGEQVGYSIDEFEGLVAIGLAKIRKRTDSDAATDFRVINA